LARIQAQLEEWSSSFVTSPGGSPGATAAEERPEAQQVILILDLTPIFGAAAGDEQRGAQGLRLAVAKFGSSVGPRHCLGGACGWRRPIGSSCAWPTT